MGIRWRERSSAPGSGSAVQTSGVVLSACVASWWQCLTLIVDTRDASLKSSSPTNVPQILKTMTAKKRKPDEKTTDCADAIAHYAKTQTSGQAAICGALRAEIDAVLSKATSKIWHAMPVWFIGENPVVGYKAAPKHVNLLFWSGQSFAEPALKPLGKFQAAQIQFTEIAQIAQIAPTALLRWLKKASKDIWDYHSHFTTHKALQKKGKRCPPGLTTGWPFQFHFAVHGFCSRVADVWTPGL